MPDGELKLGRLCRDMAATDLAVRRAENDARVELSFSASSEMPIDRWYGTEVLSHDKGAIRMQRIEVGAVPLLFNHDWSDPIGMIDAARVHDGRLLVDAHLFATARAKEVATMVDGGLRNVSIGYQVHVFEEETKTQRFTARDWEPLEISIVTVPADASIGIGRTADDKAIPVRVVRIGDSTAEPATTQGAIMAEVTAPAGAPADPEVRMSAVQAEQERKKAIEALGQANSIDQRVVERWIRDGTPLSKVADELLQVMEERGRERPSVAAALGLTSKETQRYSLFKAIRAMRYGGSDRRFVEEASFEMECSRAVAQKMGRTLTSSILVPAEVLQRPVDREAVQRAMSTTPGASGGYLVNVDNMGFIDILRNRSVAMSMGARVLSGLQGNVTFARQTAKPSVTWQAGEHVSVTAADQTLGQLSMTPKTCIAITDVSEQLLAQSSPSAEAFIMADLAQNVAIDGVDNAVINGTGGAQPIGIKNTSGITSGQDASSATYAKVLAFVSTAAGSNAIRGRPGFVTNAAGAAVLMQKQRFSSTDTPLWDGNIMDGQLVGFRAMASEQLASGNIVFGSWDEVVIGEWGVLELSTDNGGTRFNTYTVGIRAAWMVDVMIRYPQAFVVGTNLSA